MIGKGKSIAHTQASIAYGWNEEKNAEVVFRQHLSGENPKELTEEFTRIQQLNHHCKKNTLSFVLSPTIKDGEKLEPKKLRKIVKEFMTQMKLKDRQAIAFVHRDKAHKHIHLYVNRIDFNGTAYNDSFVGKRSQKAAENTAGKLRMTTVRQVQFEKDLNNRKVKQEIIKRHEHTLKYFKPKDYDQYINGMAKNGVDIKPSINKQGQVQGFRFYFNDQNFKGSAIHRNMSMGNIGKGILENSRPEKLISAKNTINLLGKVLPVPQKLALSIAKKVVKHVIQKGIGI